jgi:hypothetical protein
MQTTNTIKRTYPEMSGRSYNLKNVQYVSYNKTRNKRKHTLTAAINRIIG